MTGCHINFHSCFVILELKLLTTFKSGSSIRLRIVLKALLIELITGSKLKLIVHVKTVVAQCYDLSKKTPCSI